MYMYMIWIQATIGERNKILKVFVKTLRAVDGLVLRRIFLKYDYLDYTDYLEIFRIFKDICIGQTKNNYWLECMAKPTIMS